MVTRARLWVSKASNSFRLQRDEPNKLSTKGGQLPWKYLWIVDISALSYQRAFSVGSALKRTMQTMHLEGWFPPEWCQSYSFADGTGKISGVGVLSTLMIGWLSYDQSKHVLYHISKQLLSNRQVFQVVIFSAFYSVLLLGSWLSLLSWIFFFRCENVLWEAANFFAVQYQKLTNQITSSIVDLQMEAKRSG